MTALPAPFAGESIVSHAFVFTTSHAQPASTVSDTVVPPGGMPSAVCARAEGVTTYTQGAAACTTGKICPATSTAPVRATMTGFASSAYETVPLPLLPPGGMGERREIQSFVLPAFHTHTPGAVMLNEFVLAAKPCAPFVGDSA